MIYVKKQNITLFKITELLQSIIYLYARIVNLYFMCHLTFSLASIQSLITLSHITKEYLISIMTYIYVLD